MFLLIDNYDSFTYNLVQAFYALGKIPWSSKTTIPGCSNWRRTRP